MDDFKSKLLLIYNIIKCKNKYKIKEIYKLNNIN